MVGKSGTSVPRGGWCTGGVGDKETVPVTSGRGGVEVDQVRVHRKFEV